MKRFAACCGWLAALFCLSFTLSASAETLLVDPSGGAGAYDSVTAALAAARDGDTVLLAGGVYDETRERFPIMIDQSVALVAAEGETPVIRSPKLMAAMKITAAGASVSGLTFEFLRSGLWVLADDVAVADCAFTLADEIWRTSSCGMWVGGAKRMTLTDSAFSGCGIALAGPPIGESSKGLPVLEAWAAGTPVVAAEHGAFPEMTADTGGGLLCAPSDPAALAAALRRLVLDPQLAARCARRAQQAVRIATGLVDEPLALGLGRAHLGQGLLAQLGHFGLGSGSLRVTRFAILRSMGCVALKSSTFPQSASRSPSADAATSVTRLPSSVTATSQPSSELNAASHSAQKILVPLGSINTSFLRPVI